MSASSECSPWRASRSTHVCRPFDATILSPATVAKLWQSLSVGWNSQRIEQLPQPFSPKYSPVNIPTGADLSLSFNRRPSPLHNKPALLLTSPSLAINHPLRTTTRVVRYVAIGDRALGQSRRTLQTCSSSVDSAIERRRQTPIRRIVLQGVDASRLDHRPSSRVGRSTATELIGSRLRVPQQHRRRITVILQTGIEHTHRETTSCCVP